MTISRLEDSFSRVLDSYDRGMLHETNEPYGGRKAYFDDYPYD